MFLKTFPPAVAIHSEWRSSKSCTLPLFFNDSTSDSDLASVSGTPIPQKIQMIIESLHSTQSSDMTDNAQDAHSSHEDGYKGHARPSDMSERSRRTDARRQTAGSDTGEDSDSDDSVDRGIEEAIQEYLKEKVDHKRKGDPVTDSPPAVKLQCREPSVPDATKQHTHSSGGKVLTASNHIQISSIQPLKKKVKKKRPSKENPFKKTDVIKGLSVRSSPLSRTNKGSSSSSEVDRSPPRLIIKEEWQESSSDDGIEEEIQRFQQKKKDTRDIQQTEDTNSSSDEGIEEAIRCFQAEKQRANNKNPLTLALPVPLKLLSKKSSKKKLTTKKIDRPASLTISQFLNKCSSQSSKFKALTTPPTSPLTTDTEHQIHSSLNVNTADLMCAEAILDISKTVMPEVFESSFNRNQTFPTTDDKSNESSVDSEDGIEQEIKKFLEHKAQMNKEPSSYSEGPMAGKELKKKETQSSKVRLSLSRKRKFKEEQSKPWTDGDVACDIKGEPSGKTSVHSESNRCHISSPGISALLTVQNNKPKQNSSAHNVLDGFVLQEKASRKASRSEICSERNDSSDKSSSLDSDEDLDAAIKDLLKTKKKVKKKVRDLKARKGPSEVLNSDTLKKPKATTEQKNIPPVKIVRSSCQMQAKSDMSPEGNASKSKSGTQHWKPPTGLGNGGDVQERSQETFIKQTNDDDSDVDSDDSIEQEIRKFLAERAKVATPVHSNIKQEEDHDKDLEIPAECKPEHEHIAIEAPALNNETHAEKQSADLSSVVARQTGFPAEADGGPVLTRGNSSIKVFCKTENQNLEISMRDPRNDSTPVSHFTMNSSSFTSTSETSRTSDQHPNLFLMASENVRMNERTECSVTDCNDRQTSRTAHRIPLSEVLRSVCPLPFPKTNLLARSPFPDFTTHDDVLSSTNQGSRTEDVNIQNSVNRDKIYAPHQPLPVLQPDQTLFPSLSSQNRNNLQVRQSQPSEYSVSLGQTQREGGDKKESIEQEEGVKEDEEEKCVDDTDVESDENREDQKMKAGRQPQSSQSLSTSIDPGILLSPYIALDTEERRLKFRNRRLQVQKQLQVHTSTGIK